MEIAFAPEFEPFIREQIQSGRYASATEVIFAGLQTSLLREREQAYKSRFEELWQEISIGLSEAEAGEVIDAEIVFQNLHGENMGRSRDELASSLRSLPIDDD